MAAALMKTSSASVRGVGVSAGKGRAGFSLLEMLLAVAVGGLVAAVVLPSVTRTLESGENRRAAFHFVRLALDLRALAFRDEQAVKVVDSGDFTDDPEADPRIAEIKLDDGWTYRLAGPLLISPRGVCDVVDVDVFFRERQRLRLNGASDCTFTWERAV